jgi:hypothetical protein
MNFTYAWKVMAGVPVTDKILMIVLFAGATVGAAVALWNVAPLAVEYGGQLHRRYVRFRARRHRTWVPRAGSSSFERAASGRADHGSRRAPWLVVAAFAAVSVIGGVALGFTLNRNHEPTYSAQLTQATPDAAHLRIDYELRGR